MARNRNRYTRKRYWQIRRKAIISDGSAKKHKQQNNKRHRRIESQQLHRTAVDDSWDVYANPRRIEPWAEWPQGCIARNWCDENSGPKLTAEEARRLPGRLHSDWLHAEASENYQYQRNFAGKWAKIIAHRAKRNYVDFNLVYNWLIKNYCNPKFNQFELMLSRSKQWRTHFWGSCSWQIGDSTNSSWRFPPASRLKDWLWQKTETAYQCNQRHCRLALLAQHAETLGYWWWTDRHELEYPEQH